MFGVPKIVLFEPSRRLGQCPEKSMSRDLGTGQGFWITNRRSKFPVLLLAALTVPRPSCLLYVIAFQGSGFFLQGLSYQDLTEQCFQLLVHQLNAGFKLLEHGFADMQFFTVIEAPGPEQ